MSIAAVGSLGNGAVGVTAATTCAVTTSAAIEAGNVALLWWTSNNSSTTDGDNNEHLTVTDSAGAVSWTKLGEYTNGEGAADAGVTTSIWYRPKQAGDLASSSAITGTRTDARADQCMLAWEFSCATELELDGGPTGDGVDASNGFGSASLSSLASKERLYFRALGKEANVAATNDLTPSTDFTATANIRSRNNAAATCLRGEFRINTSTGETSNPTFAFSGDTASVFVGLVESAITGTATATPGGAAIGASGAMSLDATATATAGGAAIAGTSTSTVTGTATAAAGGGAIAGSGTTVAGAPVRRPVITTRPATAGLRRHVWKASAVFLLPAGAITGTSEVFGVATATAGGGAIAGTSTSVVTGTATIEVGGAAVAGSGAVSIAGTATAAAGGAAIGGSGSGGGSTLPTMETPGELAVSSANPVTSLAVDKPADAAAGKVCVVWAFGRAASAGAPPTWTSPTGTWTLIRQEENTVDMSLVAWWRLLDGTEAATFTVTTDQTTNQGMGVGAFVIDGANATSPIHVSGATESSGNEATVTWSDLTTTEPSLIVRLVAFTVIAGGSVTCDTTAGYTEEVDDHTTNASSVRRGGAMQWKAFATPGSTGAETTTLSAARIWQTLSFAVQGVGTAITGTATFAAGGAAVAGSSDSGADARPIVMYQWTRSRPQRAWRRSAQISQGRTSASAGAITGTVTIRPGGASFSAQGHGEGAATFEAGGAAAAGTGTIEIIGTATAAAGGAAIAAAGTPDIVGTGAASPGGAAIDGAGTIEIVGMGTATPGGAEIDAAGDLSLDATATVEAGGGAIASTGTIDIAGTATATPGGARFAALGGEDGAADFVAGGAAVGGAGDVSQDATATAEPGGASIAAAGTIEIIGTATVEPGGAAIAGEGHGAGQATVTVGGAEFAASGALSQDAPTTITAGGGAVEGAGTVEISGTATIAAGGGRVAASGRIYPPGQISATDLTNADYRCSDLSSVRTTITEVGMEQYLWVTEDVNLEALLRRKDSETGILGPATGLTDIEFRISATAGGAAIGALTFTAAERGETARYYAVADKELFDTELPEATYPDGTAVYLVLEKSGDIEARSWRKVVRRNRVGDG